MKSLFLSMTILSAALAPAAEPWICTTPGTHLIYESSIFDVPTDTLDKVVSTGRDGEILLTYTQGGQPIVERWRIYPDSTVLQIEAPAEMYALLDTLQVRDVEIRQRNLALPAVMNPGDTFPGFGFSLSGARDGEHATLSVLADSVRVVGRTTLRTPAGRFEALRLEFRTLTTIGDQQIEGRMIQWISPGIGVIRQEIPVCEDAASVQELQKITQNP